MLNKYLDRLERLNKTYRDFTLSQFVGPYGENAQFDDLSWTHIDPNTGRRTRYLCGRNGGKAKGVCSLASEPLPSPYDHLIKVWIIETSALSISSSEKTARTAIARKLLSSMTGDLYGQTASTIKNLNLGGRAPDRLRSFLVFCFDKGLMPKVELDSNDSRDRTGHGSLDSTREKLPNIQTLLAIGSTFVKIFENVAADGMVSPGHTVKMHDALVVTYVLLSLASPNRAAAEISVLPKQRLQSYSEGSADSVYYLDWIGSKGYKNNKNHMLRALTEPIIKAINFFHDACEPARILCRFYENPKQSMKSLVGDYKIAKEFVENVPLNTPPNLFVLGYALGFYGANDVVPVLKKGVSLSARYPTVRGSCFEDKPIYLLGMHDFLSVSQSDNIKISSLPKLFGYKNIPNFFVGKDAVSVEEVQAWWVKFYKDSILPEFPYSFSQGENSIKLKNAMFCFLGDWFYDATKSVRGGGKILQKSKYAVVPLASLGSSCSRRLAGRHQGLSILESYGYSSELTVRMHSLRHLSNTLADLSSIPVEIITAWSGRKNSEQTHTYIHTSHEDKAERVVAIVNPIQPSAETIRTISRGDISRITNLPATITSTGLCTQNLNVTPCNYLNDFVSQCLMCPETCHVAGDEEAIRFFEKDFLFQKVRLESVSGDVRLPASEAMKRWYVIHSRNIYVLSLLIDLMKEQPVGTIIRYSNSQSEFNLTDLKTSVTTKVTCALPDCEEMLQRVLENSSAGTSANPNAPLRSLLASFGLVGKDI